MESRNQVYCANRDEWRDWLSRNSSSEREIWLIYYKKHTGKSRVPYDEAVAEALCFGWIDSTVRKIDDERYMQRFTPRNKGSKWSAHNVRRAEEMIKAGKMTPAGLVLYKEWKSKGKPPLSRSGDQFTTDPPQELLRALKKNKKALYHFHQMAPSYKKLYIGWINNAKKEETKIRRIEKAVTLLEKNIKSFM